MLTFDLEMPMRRISRLLFLETIKESIVKGDIVARQRFHLFKLATLYTLVIYTSFLVQMSSVDAINIKVLLLVTCLFIAISINYLSFAFHRKQETASIMLLGLLYTLLHIVAYRSGGLRNSTMLYIPALILLAYMLLGKKGGMVMAGLTLFHLALFYYFNRNTSWVNYDMFGNDPRIIDFDFFVTAVLGILMVTVQAGYIERSKNEIIEDINNKNLAFKQLNESLEKKIRERTKELVEKKMLLDEAQQMARIGNWNVDLVGGHVIWSDGTRAMLGVDSEFKASFDGFLSFIHPEDRMDFMNRINDPSVNHDLIESEFRIIRPDKSVHVIYSQTRCIFAKGKTIRIYGILQDITERKVAEETLKRSEANLHTIFDHTKTCYILLDTGLNVLSFNPMARDWAKNALKAELREGDNYISYYPVDRHPPLKAKADKVLKAEVDHYEISYVYPDKSVHHYEVLLSPVLIKQAVSGICIALSDITEKKQSEKATQEYVEELQLKNKNLRQFAYMVSHNLRAPIAKIQGLAYLFEENGDQENNSTLIKYIHNEVENLDHVINDMNAIITTGDAENIIREAVDFNNEFKLIAKVLENQIIESKAEITCDFRSVPSIVSVKSYIYSMMYNLLSNSIKYRDKERPLVVEVRTLLDDTGFICLSVEDNGIGINLEKHKDRIFDLYARINVASVPGKGMGLSMVKVQAETLGGRVDLESELNKGSIFRIFLPPA